MIQQRYIAAATRSNGIRRMGLWSHDAGENPTVHRCRCDASTMAITDGSPMEGCDNFTRTEIGNRVSRMASTLPARRRPPRTPPGCEGHLTRQQAAELLGFSSEFKIRQLEREGRLRSVRGLMRTAFYARADVLAIKAELEQESPGRSADDDWTDDELLVLLRQPNREGRARTALDLVLETHISIDRAEKVYAFWTSCGGAVPATTAAPRPPVQNQQGHPAPGTTIAPDPRAASPKSTIAPHPGAPSPKAAVPPHPTEASPQPAFQLREPLRTPQAAALPPEPLDRAADERRSAERLSRDDLIAELRHPDPRVRDRAFARLKEQNGG